MIVSKFELTRIDPMDHYTMSLAARENLLFQGNLSVACGKQTVSYFERSSMHLQKNDPKKIRRAIVMGA